MMQQSILYVTHMCVLLTGAQLHHLSHAGLTGRVGDCRQPGGLNWSPYHEDDSKFTNSREPVSLNTELKKGQITYLHLEVFEVNLYGHYHRRMDR